MKLKRAITDAELWHRLRAPFAAVQWRMDRVSV
jgi:hypothetical protein